jgi:uncharacterized protein with PQ loop repeat
MVTAISSAAFIVFAVTNVLIFLVVAKNIKMFSIPLGILLTANCLLWTIHGYLGKDISLMCSSGLGTLTFGILLGARMYNKVKYNNN